MEMRSQVHRRRHRGTKWLYAILILFIIFGLIWAFFDSAMGPVIKAQDKYEALVVNDKKLKSVDSFYHLSRDGVTFYSLIGKNPKNEASAVIYSTSNNRLTNHATTVDMQGKMTSGAVRRQVESEYHPKQITSLGMALYQDVPVWDVTFIDKSGNMNFITYQISNGQEVRTIQNL